MGNFEGLKRFIEISPSPYHGLNFCQGTVCESLENPGTEIFDIIRYFGERDKIFNVHFRNIKGNFCDFYETFPDEGDIDFLEAIKIYKEVGYEYMLMPDHVPQIAGPEPQLVAFAFIWSALAIYTWSLFKGRWRREKALATADPVTGRATR